MKPKIEIKNGWLVWGNDLGESHRIRLDAIEAYYHDSVRTGILVEVREIWPAKAGELLDQYFLGDPDESEPEERDVCL